MIHFLRRETNSKENVVFFFMNMETATNFIVVDFTRIHNQSTGQSIIAHLNSKSWLQQLSEILQGSSITSQQHINLDSVNLKHIDQQQLSSMSALHVPW